MVPGSLLGTWNDGFGIERPALPICVSSIVIGSCHNLQRVYLKISKINKRKLRFVEKVTWLHRLRCPCSFAITTFGSSCIGLSEVVVVSPTAGSVWMGDTSSAGEKEDNNGLAVFADGSADGAGVPQASVRGTSWAGIAGVATWEGWEGEQETWIVETVEVVKVNDSWWELDAGIVGGGLSVTVTGVLVAFVVVWDVVFEETGASLGTSITCMAGGAGGAVDFASSGKDPSAWKWLKSP